MILIFSKGSALIEEKCSPTSSSTSWLDEHREDPIAVLKRNVSDTLTFLHQERNDFLPEDDIIIPSRKEDHVSREINLDSINLRAPKKSTLNYSEDELRDLVENEVDEVIKEAEEIVLSNVKENHVPEEVENPKQSTTDYSEEGLREAVETEVEDVIKKAEDVVNHKLNDLEFSSNKTLKFSDEVIHIDSKPDYFEEKVDSLGEDVKTLTEDSLDNLESLKDDSISIAQEKSDEAFKFLENEVSSPVCTKQAISEFLQKESVGELHDILQSDQSKSPKSPKSSIPVARTRKSLEKEKDVDILLSDDKSKTNHELLTKIPVMKCGKIKTIKKHSKDPLKEFVTLSKDVNWDDDGDATEIITTITSEPITTITKITESTPETIRSKIPVLHADIVEHHDHPESDIFSKSKIPVLKSDNTKTTVTTETITSPNSTKVVETFETYITSPGSRVSTKSSTLDSDSDEDSTRSPPLKGILKKSTCVRTIGSSSGSDIALHEEGAELSEDESGMSNLSIQHLLLLYFLKLPNENSLKLISLKFSSIYVLLISYC